MTKILTILIATISIWLISEAGAYFGSGFFGYLQAALLEGIVLFSMVARNDSKFSVAGSRNFKIVKIILIAAILVFVTGAAALKALREVVTHPAPSHVLVGIDEINKDLERLGTTLTLLSGQPRNIALTAGQIRELQVKKNILMGERKPDTSLKIYNFASCIIPIGVRILLQIGNLFLLTLLKCQSSSDVIPKKILESVQGDSRGEHGQKNNDIPRQVRLAEDEQKIVDKITVKGGCITFQKLAESKILTGGTKTYDDVLAKLVRAGVLAHNAHFNKSYHIFSLKNGGRH